MNTKVTLARLDTGTVHDSSEDFTLPDYLPEVRRIVTCTGSVLPESKYIDRGEITLSGLVVYTVYYLGDDGSLNAAPLNSEYTVQIPCQGADITGLSVGDLITKTTLESVSCRATGPRRLTLSGRMRSKVFSTADGEIGEMITSVPENSDGRPNAACEMTLERHRSPVECSSSYTSAATGGISGEMREREGTKLISCGGTAAVTDARLDGGMITVRGDGYINCLVMSPEGEYSTVRIKAPFEEKLPFDKGTSLQDDVKKSVSAVARCAAVNLSGGDGGVYNWDMEYDIEAVVCADYISEITDDMYSTAHETRIADGEADIVTCLKNGNSRLSVNASKPTSGEGKSIAHVSCKASADRAECDSEGKIVINGVCTVAAMLVGGGDVNSEEVEIPYRFECDCKRPGDGVPSVMCEVSVISADARLDGDRLSATSELGISLFATAMHKKKYVGEVTIDCDTEAGLRSSCVKICFPYENETMWDIGKRYHCEQKHIRPLEGTTSVMIAVE